MGKKEMVYQTSCEVEHPDYPEVKMILSNHLIKEFLELNTTLGEQVKQQRKEQEKAGQKGVFVLSLLGNYVIYYAETGGDLLVMFLPFTLKKAVVKNVLKMEYFVPYYEQMVAMATVDPHYPGGRIEFVPLKYDK